MKLITSAIKSQIENVVIEKIQRSDFLSASNGIEEIVDEMYRNIPQNKRISYGIVHTVKELGNYLFLVLNEKKISVFDTASSVFDNAIKTESKAVSLCLMTLYGVEFPTQVFPYFEKAAADNDWELREITQILFRKLIKKHSVIVQQFLLQLVKSADENKRRFVVETLRPVCENKWFYKNPEYSLAVIHNLFNESKAYPRTSVGNYLSDISRQQPELIYKIIEDLVSRGDKNSYWIAYRACRNLVKKEPERVMKLLGIDRYKYKNRIFEK